MESKNGRQRLCVLFTPVDTFTTSVCDRSWAVGDRQLSCADISSPSPSLVQSTVCFRQGWVVSVV